MTGSSYLSFFNRRTGVGIEDDGFGSLSSGYGHSGYGSSHSSYGGHGGHGGGYSSGYGHDDCCPLVVDPLTLTAILGAIAAATAFFNVLITMNITRRKKRETNILAESLRDTLWKGNGKKFHFGRI